MTARFVVNAFFIGVVLVIIGMSGCSKNSTGDVAIDDGIAPAVVTDLAVAGFTDSSVTLNWTATGDDTTSGTASSYDLRISSAYINWDNFDSARRSGGAVPDSEFENRQYLLFRVESSGRGRQLPGHFRLYQRHLL